MSIYFASRDSLIKIGTSRDPHARTRALDSYLLAVGPGSYEEERTMHDWFATDRVYGEWFRPSRPLLALIDGLITDEAAQNLGLAPLRAGRHSTKISERMPDNDVLFSAKRRHSTTQSHGTYLRYNEGCRCDGCKKASSERRRGAAAWKKKYRETVARLEAAERTEAAS